MTDFRIAARDPGAANLLSHLLLDSQLRNIGECDLWLTDNIADYFSDIELPKQLFSRPPSHAELKRKWDDNPARAIITGTSHYEAFDSLFWKLGKQNSVPTLAVVDYWSNLGERFKDSVPDAVGVIDEGQAIEARRLGLPDTVITGHPSLAAIRPAPPREPDDRVAVLFVCERIAGDHADGVLEPYGFDEIDVFRLVLDAVRKASQQGIRADLVVKFHPYNDRKEFLSAVGPLPEQSMLSVEFIDGRKPIAPLVAASDLVVGVASIALVEAALMERAVISVQPGLIREDTFIPGVRGYAETLTDAEEAIKRLTALIVDPSKRDQVTDRLKGFRNSLDTGQRTPVCGWLRSVLFASPPVTTKEPI